GDALLPRLPRRARREPRRAPSPRQPRRSRQACRAGGRNRARDAAELRRQQALVVPPFEALSSLSAVRVLLAAALAAVAAVVLAPAALGAPTTPTAPVYDGRGHLIQIPFVPQRPGPQLTDKSALRAFERDPKVAGWLARYPRSGRSDDETFAAKSGHWTV